MPSPPEIQSAFDALVRTLPECEVYDQGPPPEDGGQRADYLLFARSIVAELKSLPGDTSAAVDSFCEQLVRDSRLVCYGQLGVEQIIAKQPDPEAARRRLADRIAAPFTNAFAEANRQIRATKVREHIPDALGIVLLVNLANAPLSNEVVIYSVRRLFSRQVDRRPGFSSVHAVLYFPMVPSHARRVGGEVQFYPLAMVREFASEDVLGPQLRVLMQGWCDLNGIRAVIPDRWTPF